MIFTYDSTPINYTIKGKGPTLLFIHGFLESSSMWNEILPHFSETHQVVTFDFPGHGKSQSIGEVHTMELFAEIIVALLKHLQIDSATFIGHSMGGYATMAVAEIQPKYIDKLILVNSTPEADSDARKLNRERALQLIPKAKDAFVSMAIANLFTDKAQMLHSEAISELKKEALVLPLEGIVATIKGMKDRKDRAKVLENFSKPKYMICGVDDPILPFEVCKSIAKHTKTSFIPMPGGHMTYIENYVNFVKILHLIENNSI